MSPLQQAKTWLVENLHLAKDALHIYVALALVLGSCLAFGWKVRQWRPWLLVLVAALAGEVIDIRYSWRIGDPVDYWNNWKDVWNTMVLPTVLLLAARFTPVFERPAAPSGDETQVTAAAPGGEDDLG
jgi:hypothetical protein